MLTAEEKQDIIAEVIEQVILRMPEVVGNLMTNHAALHKMNMAFYTKYPEFKDRKDIVQSTVEMIEGHNPLLDYEDLLEKSVPEIKKRLRIAADLDTETTPRGIPRDFSHVDLSNGEI